MVAVGAAVGGGVVASPGVAGGATVGAGGTGAAVAVGVAVGSTRDGVTWTTPGLRVGTGVGTGVAFLVQPAAMMSARPRIATIQSRLMLAQCLMNFLLHVVKLRGSIAYIVRFANLGLGGVQDMRLRETRPSEKYGTDWEHKGSEARAVYWGPVVQFDES